MAIVVKTKKLPTSVDVKNLYESLKTVMPADVMNSFTEDKFNKNLLDQYIRQFPDKTDIIRSWFQLFNIVEDSPGVKLYNAGWHGLSAGAGLAITMGVFPLPMSIMMNANIHHHPAMRFLTGLIGLSFWPFVLIYALIFMRGRSYFGLFPLFKGSELPPNPTYWYEWPAWIFVNIGSIVALALSPFSQGTTKEDMVAYNEFLSKHMGFLDRGSEGTVNEDLYQAGRQTAIIKDYEEWVRAMNFTGWKLGNNEQNKASPTPSQPPPQSPASPSQPAPSPSQPPPQSPASQPAPSQPAPSQPSPSQSPVASLFSAASLFPAFSSSRPPSRPPSSRPPSLSPAASPPPSPSLPPAASPS